MAENYIIHTPDKSQSRADLDSITLTSLPSKISYIGGDVVDLTGLVVTANWSDGTTSNITGDCTYTPDIIHGVKVYEDMKKVDISYTKPGATKEFTLSFPITVLRCPQKLEVSSKSTQKTSYRGDGEDGFSNTGLIMNLTYTSGKTRNPNLKEFTFYKLDKDDNAVEIKYGDILYEDTDKIRISYTENGVTVTTDYEVTVTAIPKELVYDSEDSNCSLPIKTVYTYNKAIDLEGISLKVNYFSGAVGYVDENRLTFTPSSSGAEDNQNKTITVSYSENAVVVSYPLIIKVLYGPSYIEVSTFPNKMTYFSGDTLNTTGMVVMARFTKSEDDREVTDYVIVDDKIDYQKRLYNGKQPITIRYTDPNTGIVNDTILYVDVVKKLKSIEVTTLPMGILPPKTPVYRSGYDIKTDGMVLTATYTDGTTKNVTGYKISPEVAGNVTGQRDIVVKYTENGISKSTYFSAKIVPAISSMEITGYPKDLNFYQMEELDLLGRGLEVSLTYSNGSTGVLNPRQITFYIENEEPEGYDYTNIDTWQTPLAKTLGNAQQVIINYYDPDEKKLFTNNSAIKINCSRELHALDIHLSDTNTTDPKNDNDVQLKYSPNRPINTDKLVVTAIYGKKDDTVEGGYRILSREDVYGWNLTDENGNTFTNVQSDRGYQLVNVNYSEDSTFPEGNETFTATASYYVRIVQDLGGIELVNPTKLNYYTGEELDLTGLTVIAHYTDESIPTEIIPMAVDNDPKKSDTGYLVSTLYATNNLDHHTTTQTITITYSEGNRTETETFIINVYRKAVSFKITQKPTAALYADDGTVNAYIRSTSSKQIPISLEGLIVEAQYTNGTTDTIQYDKFPERFSFVGKEKGIVPTTFISTSTLPIYIGFKQNPEFDYDPLITKDAEGNPVSFNITGLKYLEKIVAEDPPKKCKYKSDLDYTASGMKVTAYYYNEGSEELTGINWNDYDDWRTDYTANTLKAAVIHYTINTVKQEYTFYVKVARVVESITVTTSDTTKLNYYTLEPLDKTGLIVTVHFKDEDDYTENLAENQYKLTLPPGDDFRKFYRDYNKTPSNVYTNGYRIYSARGTEEHYTPAASMGQRLQITYNSPDGEMTTYYTVTVMRKPKYIQIVSPPNNPQVSPGDVFDLTGMRVNAYFYDEVDPVSGILGTDDRISINPTKMPEDAGANAQQEVVVTYTENDISTSKLQDNKPAIINFTTANGFVYTNTETAGFETLHVYGKYYATETVVDGITIPAETIVLETPTSYDSTTETLAG